MDLIDIIDGLFRKLNKLEKDPNHDVRMVKKLENMIKSAIVELQKQVNNEIVQVRNAGVGQNVVFLTGREFIIVRPGPNIEISGRQIRPKYSKNKQFGTKRKHSEFETGLCSICHVYNNNLIRLGCEHKFHRDCINEWIRISHYSNCPICREIIINKQKKIKKS